MDEAKDRLFKIIYRIQELRNTAAFRTLTDSEDLELRNLEVQKMNAWSDWKDPQ